jgi:hypothetical protein
MMIALAGGEDEADVPDSELVGAVELTVTAVCREAAPPQPIRRIEPQMTANPEV